MLIPGTVQAQSLHFTGITREAASATLNWEGGHGPYLVETSPNLIDWSDIGEPATNTQRTLPANLSEGFYRVRDLNASNLLGSFYGLIQTEQGEFGKLLARHRLKSRWWFYKPTGTMSKAPAEFFRKLIVQYQSIDNGKITTFASPLETLGAIATPGNAKQMTVTWTRGSKTAQRQFVLTLEFPYNVNATRSAEPKPSDPTYQLSCTYAEPQFEPDFYQMTPGTTKTDSVKLIELDPEGSYDWLKRRYSVSRLGITIDLAYREGNYMYQGSPLFILKTFVLHEWTSPTVIRGGPLPAFSTDSYFSHTLMPGHHNFVESVLIEPAIDPSLSKTVRDALAAANIRYICTFKDIAIGMSQDGISFIGFDNTFHSP